MFFFLQMQNITNSLLKMCYVHKSKGIYCVFTFLLVCRWRKHHRPVLSGHPSSVRHVRSLQPSNQFEPNLKVIVSDMWIILNLPNPWPHLASTCIVFNNGGSEKTSTVLLFGALRISAVGNSGVHSPASEYDVLGQLKWLTKAFRSWCHIFTFWSS